MNYNNKNFTFAYFIFLKVLRKLLLVIIFALIPCYIFGQANFYLLDIGVSGGVTYPFTDVPKGSITPAMTVNFDYYINPFITAGLEVQTGKITNSGKSDPHLRRFTNSYQSLVLNGKVRLGLFTNFYYDEFLYAVKGFYIGTGFGVIKNKMTKINRIKPDGSGYVFPGQDNSDNLVIPLNIGIDFYFFDNWGFPRYILNLNLQHNLTLNEGLDGYNDPPPFNNRYPDYYGFFTVGFKYTFGPQGLSRKTIR